MPTLGETTFSGAKLHKTGCQPRAMPFSVNITNNGNESFLAKETQEFCSIVRSKSHQSIKSCVLASL